MRGWFLFLVGPWMTVSLQAHSDPRGEKHPEIQTDAQGNFRITFRYADYPAQSWMSMVIDENGRELIPRHRLSASALRALGLPDIAEESRYRTARQNADVVSLATSEGKTRLVLQEENRPSGAVRPLPFDPPGLENLEDYTLTPNYVAVLSMLYASESVPPVDMILRTCRRGSGVPGKQLTLKGVGTIYDFPSASPPVWVNGRFWIAWVRERGPEEARTWSTVLTGFNPENGAAEHHDLPGLSHWNTHVDLAANANGTLCAAWTASLDGSYPGFARIVTAVFPTKR